MSLFNQMFALRSSLKAENRYWADYYLRNVWPAAFELSQSLRSANVAEHIEDKFQAFADYEEDRIRKNLEDIHFDIDALDTVYVVAGPGRIEKVRVVPATSLSSEFTSNTVSLPVDVSSASTRSCDLPHRQDEDSAQGRIARFRRQRVMGAQSRQLSLPRPFR